MLDQSRLVILDAIDGAGKTTVLNGLKQRFLDQGKQVFDLVEYTKAHHRLPEITEEGIAEAEVLISAEPTHCWVGAAIREEILPLHADRTPGGKLTAQAFALDRAFLFTRIILPFLRAKPGRIVLQDRGVITSFAYQPLQDPSVSLEWLQSLEGNQIELSRSPDLFLLLNIAPATALERINSRGLRVDQDIFEKASFQERLVARYRDAYVLASYRAGGTQIQEIDASQTPDRVTDDAWQEIQKVL